MVHWPQLPRVRGPYAVAIVELEEGWHMLSNIVDCHLDEDVIGTPVEVVFRKTRDETTCPCFRPRR